MVFETYRSKVEPVRIRSDTMSRMRTTLSLKPVCFTACVSDHRSPSSNTVRLLAETEHVLSREPICLHR